MTTHTVTAMYSTRQDAERAAAAIRQDTAISTTNVRVLPERDDAAATGTTDTVAHETGFFASLRNFFMPEEDRYGYAEGMRRGSYLVAVDTDDTYSDRVMNILEDHGAIDMDAEEKRWRAEGWRGYQPDSAATGIPASDVTATDTGFSGAAVTGSRVTGTPATAGPAVDRPPTAPVGTPRATAMTGTAETAVPSETIPLAEETVRIGKRQVNTGRVRVRTYVVETPVNETVHLREEHVEVERRPVDRPARADEDPFREREIEATTSREEPVVSKETRVREELVLHKTAEEHDETIRDTVRRTEVREDRGDKDDIGPDGTVDNPRADNPRTGPA
ncbi:YsnF/AvaK domain-containing protein [Rhodopila globiformis]|uniref:DUF2382 domain-containing protein n=1 Tax=Rhodopila globiformis TaxID=1071 RepID=A0A2S6NKP6_RHOGL|nr:YsnF/AvaK domain-containing protein [Rhodopila globiformis]PPQ35610.1 hypothetical protein CCS01_06995 [Rhodopila globiformis]